MDNHESIMDIYDKMTDKQKFVVWVLIAQAAKATIKTPESEDRSLAHHGIKGMHWGIRRYQNYDGSYTQEGLRRYNKSLGDYEKAKQGRKDGTGTKGDVRIAKRQLDKNYKQLKKDYYADHGKDLYQQGKTVNTNIVKSHALTAAAGVADAVAAAVLNSPVMQQSPYNTPIKVAAVGANLLSGALMLKYNQENAYLRAYYSHSRKKN